VTKHEILLLVNSGALLGGRRHHPPEKTQEIALFSLSDAFICKSGQMTMNLFDKSRSELYFWTIVEKCKRIRAKEAYNERDLVC